MEGVDQDTINTFMQLREKVFNAYRARQKNDEQMGVLERGVMHKKLVLAEMSQLPADVTTYKNVGKAYIFTPKSSIVASYEADFQANEADIKRKRADRDTLAKAITSSEDELKEHLQSNPALANQVAQEVQ